MDEMEKHSEECATSINNFSIASISNNNEKKEEPEMAATNALHSLLLQAFLTDPVIYFFYII